MNKPWIKIWMVYLTYSDDEWIKIDNKIPFYLPYLANSKNFLKFSSFIEHVKFAKRNPWISIVTFTAPDLGLTGLYIDDTKENRTKIVNYLRKIGMKVEITNLNIVRNVRGETRDITKIMRGDYFK